MGIFKKANENENENALYTSSGFRVIPDLDSSEFIKEDPSQYNQEKLDRYVFHLWESERVRELAHLGAIPNRIYVLENGKYITNPAASKDQETRFNKMPGFKYVGLGKLVAYQNEQGQLVNVEDDIQESE